MQEISHRLGAIAGMFDTKNVENGAVSRRNALTHSLRILCDEIRIRTEEFNLWYDGIFNENMRKDTKKQPNNIHNEELIVKEVLLIVQHMLKLVEVNNDDNRTSKAVSEGSKGNEEMEAVLDWHVTGHLIQPLSRDITDMKLDKVLKSK